MIEFPERLKQLRINKNLTQKDLASILGVKKCMISAYENSTRTPSHQVFIRIALYFKVTTDFLYGIDNRELVDITGVPDEISKVMSILINYERNKA